VNIRLDTRFPEDGKATLTFTAKEPRQLSVAVRCPGWLKVGAMKLAVNGEAQKMDAKPGSYAVIERTWKTGDRVEMEWPMTVRTELLPHSSNWVAVLWGPVVLAGELGTNGLTEADFHNHNYQAGKRQPIESAPVFVGAAETIAAKVKPVAGRSLVFRSDGLASPAEVTLVPLYRVHHQRYAVYWKLTEREAAGTASPSR
jgi:DUF1680 family protein